LEGSRVNRPCARRKRSARASKIGRGSAKNPHIGTLSSPQPQRGGISHPCVWPVPSLKEAASVPQGGRTPPI